MVRTHFGDSTGELLARMPSEQLDIAWTACDLWARARKADGDPRTLDQLRVAALVQWAQSYLHHGDPTHCDKHCTPGSHGGTVDPDPDPDTDDGGDGDRDGDDRGPAGPVVPMPTEGDASPGEALVSRPPTRHGRPAAVRALWDLTSLLALTRHHGELADSGAVLGPDAMTDLVAGGIKVRRRLIHADNGEMLDLTPRSWRLPRTKPTDLDAPVLLDLILTVEDWQAINDGTAAPALLAAVAAAPQAIRDLLAYQWTADRIDDHPDAYPPGAQFCDFIAERDRHPTNPTAASAADLEHPTPVSHGGKSVQTNATCTTRRWHNLKTHGGWRVQRHERGWKWTSPTGRTYLTGPYDYRLGP